MIKRTANQTTVVNTVITTITEKMATALFVCLTLTVTAISTNSYADSLPPPIQRALSAAGVAPEHMSLVILPVSPVVPDTSTNSAINTIENETALPSNSVSNQANVLPPHRLVPVIIDIDPVITETKHPTRGDAKSEVKTGVVAKTLATPLSGPIRYQADIPRTPASTMKLIPTFIALDILGPDFTWVTRVYHTGWTANNTLHGDLIIKASGDPKLTQKRLLMLLDKVQKTGIHHITGNIVIDDSIFQNVGKDPAAYDNQPLRAYNVSPDGFLINFNILEMTTKLGSNGLAAVTYDPQLADYTLPNTVPLRSGDCLSVRVSLAPKWQPEGLTFNRGLPRGCAQHHFYIAYPDVKDFGRRVVKQQWLDLGNSLDGEVISTEQPLKNEFGIYTTDRLIADSSNDVKADDVKLDDVKADDVKLDGLVNGPMPSLSLIFPAAVLPIAIYPSLPLSRQIYDINHHSNNVMTEQVALSLGAYAPMNETDNIETTSQSNPQLNPQSNQKPLGSPRISSYPSAIATIENWWRHHLQTPPPHLTNGSGLCRSCTLTANNLAELLSYAYQHPDFETYLHSLGVAGYSGTIKGHKNRLPQSEAIRQAWIKTGTLNKVTSMAGYVHGNSGQDYVVVGIINTPHRLNTYQARVALDTMLHWTASH